jgi:hypothetical protein
MNRYEWLKFGIDNGFCSDLHCDTHNGIPMTDEEAEAFDAGDDWCCHVVRVFDGTENIH